MQTQYVLFLPDRFFRLCRAAYGDLHAVAAQLVDFFAGWLGGGDVDLL